MLAGSAVFFAAAFLAGEFSGFQISAVSTASALGWLYLVTLGGIVGFASYVYMLHAVSPAKVATHGYVNPIVAVFLGWAIAGEPVTARTLAAAVVILAGVALISAAQTEGRA
jgi:drug/metabolite transporter (DMT)-like permease